MPDSSWTETGSSISLIPTTTPIDPGSSPANANYLTNAYKAALMQQYAGELAMKTSLDSLATTWGCSATAYNNAVAAINTTITGFSGAPANWATIWPDGTMSGPWLGVQTLLAANWATIATQRTALQGAISAAQASAAQAASVAAAATDATNKSNAAILASQPHQVAWAYASKPTLPSGSYPAGYYAITTDARTVQVNTSGTAWTDVLVATTGLFGQVVASQIVVNNQGPNLVPDPMGSDLGSWSSAVQITGITDLTVGSTAVANATGASATVLTTALIPIDQAKNYLVQMLAKKLVGSAGVNYLSVAWYGATGNFLASNTAQPTGAGSPAGWNNGSYSYFGLIGADAPTTWTKYTINFGPAGPAAIPSNARFVKIGAILNYSAVASYQAAISQVKLLECTDGSLIVNGTVTTANLVTGVAIADIARVGSLTARYIYFTDGFCLNTLEPKEAGANVTSAHVLTAMANETSTATATGVTNVAIPGLAFSLNASSTSDVYNFFGSMSGAQTAGTVGFDCYIKLYVDGVFNQSALITYPVLNGTVANSIVLSLTGLSAGAHTVQFYLSPANSTSTFQSYVGTTVLCQRIF
jgi:hypothetical protein